MQADSILYLVAPADRPPFYRVADHLWGPDANVDSDGNSMNPDDTLWTELSLWMREGPADAEVHIDPSSFEPLVLQIRSPNAGLAEKVAEYLLVSCGGRITHELLR